MTTYVGTSGYSIKEWKGKFYPQDLPQKSMLGYYSEHFQSVEINNTFYRMPAASMLEGWVAEVPESFRFAIKAPQQITHRQRLINSSDSVRHLLEVADVLGPRLGPLLFQLPPNFKKDLPRLQAFLQLLPKTFRVAFEFRNPTWFTDDVFTLLKEQAVALCIAEDDNSLQVPVVSTADWGYLRLRRLDYVDATLTAWANVIQKQNWSDTFVYFKHEDDALGPAFAAKFLSLINRR